MLLSPVAIATLAIASVATSHATSDALSRYRALRTSQSALIRAKEDMLDEETSIRGYAATRDPVFLQPYYPALKRLHYDLAYFRTNIVQANRPDLLPVATTLDDLNARWIRTVAQPTLRARDPHATLQLQLRGKAIVDRFRAVELRNELELTQQIRSVFGTMSARITETTVLSGVLLALIALAAAIVAALTSRVRSRLRTERQVKTLVDMMPQIVWIADASGATTYLNQRWHEYTGQSSEDALGRGWVDAVHPEDTTRTMERWQASVRSGSPFEIEYRLRSSYGSYQWFVGRGLPERDERGTIVRWLGTCTDVQFQHAQLESVQHVADTFARALLPQTLPQNELVEFHATYLPAEDVSKVGGDWYDVFPVGANRFFFSVGDVTGHGLDAALLMSRVRQTIFAFASLESDPALILERTNRVLRTHHANMVTALCGTYDAATGGLTFASAGHPPALILRSYGAIEELSSFAPPLGSGERLAVDPVAAVLGAGDRLICYTDGIIENERDIVDGERRLRSALSSLTGPDLGQPARAIRDRILGNRRGRDDIAILVLTRSAVPSVGIQAQTSSSRSPKG